MRRLIEATFDHDERNPSFIRQVSIENIHHGKHLEMILAWLAAKPGLPGRQAAHRVLQ